MLHVLAYCALSTNALSTIDSARAVLRRASSMDRPSPREMTVALAELSNAGVHPDDWVATLEQGSPWRATFSATPAALKAARTDAEDAAPGAYLAADAAQSFSPGAFVNSVRLLGGAIQFAFGGTFEMTGRRMTLTIETLRLKLLWVLTLPFDVREGRGVRGLVERIRGGKKKKAGAFEKRPNVYAWCYADDAICVAQGSSGNVAVWVSGA